MAAHSELTLLGTYFITPDRLMGVPTRVPVDSRNFIPLLIFKRSFEKVRPTLQVVGETAISMSLGRPFGFMQPVGNDEEIVETQQVPEVTIERQPGQATKWRIAFETPKPLSATEAEIFKYGMGMYASYAQRLVQL